MNQEKEEELVSFLRENQTYFYRVANQYVGDPDLAMDLVQDAVVKALQHRDSLRDPGAVKAWFYRILVRECITFYRRNGRVVYLPQPPSGIQESCEDRMADQEMLERAVDALSPKLKTVVILRFYEGMQLSEIAQITGTNLNTVKSRLYKALGKLRESLKEA